jgi:hypothetical protein
MVATGLFIFRCLSFVTAPVGDCIAKPYAGGFHSRSLYAELC